MDFSKAWQTSRICYGELVYRPILSSGYATRDSNARRSLKNALRGAAVNKLIFSVFTVAGAVLPFLLYWLTQEQFTSIFGIPLLIGMTLRVAVSLSVILVFGYVVLYSIQVLPSFVNSGSFAPLSLLPLTARETSVVAVLTLWRTIDYVLVLSLVSEFSFVVLVTRSFAAALIVVATAGSGSVLAIVAALWLTSIFQSKLETSSMAGLRGFFRPVMFVLWGLGVMSAVFLFSLITYLAPPLNLLLSQPSNPLGFVASIVFPFSAGLLVSFLAGETVSRLWLAGSTVGIALAVGSCAAALYGIRRIITGVVLPSRLGTSGGRLPNLAFKVRGQLAGYVAKDVKVASRNPATGFLFALPVFEVFAVIIPLVATPAIRISEVLAASQVCGGFALLISFLLVTVEDRGVERRSALPLLERVRVLSKVLISTATYLVVPLTFAILFASRPSTFEGGLLIPVAGLASVFSACLVEVVVLRVLAERGKGAAVRFAAGIGSGECLIAVPGLVYFLEYLFSRNHSLSLETLTLVSALELAGSALILRMSSNEAAASEPSHSALGARVNAS